MLVPVLFAVTASLGYGPEPGAFGVHPNRLLVRWSADAPWRGGQPRTPKATKTLDAWPQIRMSVVGVKGDLAAERARLLREPGVERVDFDRVARLAYTPNDPLFPNQWEMAKIRTPEAWDLTRGQGVVVAVIDTGIDVAHPELSGRMWVNPGEVAGNGLDDDGNGYIDDINGYDFAYNDPVLDDVHGHGTSCAGIVAATQDNATQMSGVAPEATIMGLKACNDAGYLYDSYLIPAYLYAADHGAQVLSMSYYSDRVSFGERAALDYCISKGILPIAAAGNANTIYPYYPTSYDGVISVGATTQTDGKASFSNWGSWVDVAAPGVSLHAPRPGGGYTTGFSGTSGACPHVAGQAALLWSQAPNATADQVRAWIEDSAVLLNQGAFGQWTNYGRIDTRASLDAITVPPVEKDPLLRYVSPLGMPRPGTPKNAFETRFVGRGFRGARVIATAGKLQVPLVERLRDSASTPLRDAGTPWSLRMGSLVWQFRAPEGSQFAYPLAEASTQSATLTGGFWETLQPDGTNMVANRRSDGTAWIHGSFKRVRFDPNLKLVLRRHYPNGEAATETIELYNWSTNSYPYGSFTTLATNPCPTSPTTIEIPLADIRPYLDDEGAVYLRVRTNDQLPSGSSMQIDLCYLGY